jgi:hypothetical protein
MIDNRNKYPQTVFLILKKVLFLHFTLKERVVNEFFNIINRPKMCGAPKCRKRAAELAASRSQSVQAQSFDPLAPQISKAPQPVGRPRKLRVVSSGVKRR